MVYPAEITLLWGMEYIPLDVYGLCQSQKHGGVGDDEGNGGDLRRFQRAPRLEHAF
jgi:hypothetical protein